VGGWPEPRITKARRKRNSMFHALSSEVGEPPNSTWPALAGYKGARPLSFSCVSLQTSLPGLLPDCTPALGKLPCQAIVVGSVMDFCLDCCCSTELALWQSVHTSATPKQSVSEASCSDFIATSFAFSSFACKVD